MLRLFKLTQKAFSIKVKGDRPLKKKIFKNNDIIIG